MWWSISRIKRIWKARVDLPANWSTGILEWVGGFNATEFCGVAGGRLQFVHMEGDRISDGLIRCEVELVEGTERGDGYWILDENLQRRWSQSLMVVGFDCLFPGEHAIVGIGGKEVA
jgi:hypothetical protein